MLLAVWPVAVPAARDHNDYTEVLDSLQKDFKGTSGNACDAAARKLEGVQKALTDISEAHAHLSVLVEANWARFFSGSLHADISSAKKVNASLVAQRHTMHKLWDDGLRHQTRLSAYLRACRRTSSLAADIHLHNVPGHHG